MIPAHAISVWLTEETINIALPDGQHLALPLSEIQRLRSVLRGQVRPAPRELSAQEREDAARRIAVIAEARRASAEAAERQRREVAAAGAARREREDAARRRRGDKAARLRDIEKMLETGGLL